MEIKEVTSLRQFRLFYPVKIMGHNGEYKDDVTWVTAKVSMGGIEVTIDISHLYEKESVLQALKEFDWEQVFCLEGPESDFTVSR